VTLAKAFYHPDEFAAEVEQVERKLKESGNVVRIRHELYYDWSGDPAVDFRIVMPDSLLTKGKLLNETIYVENMLRDLHLQERWGVYPYFNVRAQSEQEAMQEPSWA
jgi:hypothetical protein